MSHRRPIAALAMAALLVLAGCGGTGGNGTTATTTDESTPTATPTATPTPSPAEKFANSDLAAGMNATTITNSSDLLASHRATLADGRVGVMHLNISTSQLSRNTTIRQRVGADDTFLLELAASTSRGDSVSSLYSNGSTTFIRQKSPRGTTYSAVESGIYFSTSNVSNQLGNYLRFGDYNRTNVTRDGDAMVATYTADSVGNLSGMALNASRIEDFSSRVVVTESGRIRSFDIHYNVSTRRGTIAYDISYELERTSLETVEAPSWVSTARDRARMVDLSYEIVGDGVLKITHEGGDTIPAGSSVQVVLRNTPESYRGLGVFAARLTEDFEAGETIYVYRNDSTEFRGSIAVGSQPQVDAAPIPSSSTVRVTVRGPNREIISVSEFLADDEDDDG